MQAALIPSGKKFIDLTGRVFGKFKVVGYHEKRNGQHRFTCECECGARKSVIAQSLRDGKSKSCGCAHMNALRDKTRKHGGRQSPEYTVWIGMKARCSNPNSLAYKNYGGRGITVCERWNKSFQSFLDDMGPRPSAEHTIERTNNNLGYFPENCEWRTLLDQCNNTRRSRMVTWNGRTQSVTLWAKEIGVPPARLNQRLVKLKWPIERAMTEPKLRTK